MLHCIYVPIFIIHLSVEGHSDFFHVLAMVNHTVMNTEVDVAFWTMFFLDICPRVELLAQKKKKVTLFLAF